MKNRQTKLKTKDNNRRSEILKTNRLILNKMKLFIKTLETLMKESENYK